MDQSEHVVCWAVWCCTFMNHVLSPSGRKDFFTLVLTRLLCGRLVHRIVEPTHFVFSCAGQQTHFKLIWCIYGHSSDFVFIFMPSSLYLLIKMEKYNNWLSYKYDVEHIISLVSYFSLLCIGNTFGIKPFLNQKHHFTKIWSTDRFSKQWKTNLFLQILKENQY